MPKVGLIDVAQLAGVSKATASMALNGSPAIARATRRRVLRSAQRLGYLPRAHKAAADALARADHTGACVLALCGQQNLTGSAYYTAVTDGVASELKRQWRDMVFCHWSTHEMQQQKIPETLVGRKTEGVIVTGICEAQALLALQAQQVPMVLAATNLILPNCDYLGPANEEAVRLAFAHLRHLGHRRILAITGDRSHVDWQRKGQTFVGLAVEDRIEPLVIEVGSQPSQGEEAWRQVAQLAPKITAILATSDYLAIQALGVLHNVGCKCPDQISIASIDNTPASQFTIPPLTSVDVQMHAVGRLAARQLMDRMDYPDLPVVAVQPVASLVQRVSCREVGTER